MSPRIENTSLPSTLEAKLRRIRWRHAGLALVRAAAISAAVLILAMLAAMLADWALTFFSTGVRTALTATCISLALATFLLLGVRPVIQTLGWTEAAHQVDTQVPQLEERWTTISHFTRSQHQPGTTLSKAMLQQVTHEAVALGKLVEPTLVVRLARLRAALIAAGASVALLIVFLACNWPYHSVLLHRFWAPTAQIAATQLESVTGDAAVPRGQTVNLVVRLSGLPCDAATLMLVTDPDASTDTGSASTIALTASADAPGRFMHRVDVEESFRYRVRSGDGQTQWHTVTAIDPPELSDVRLTISAPEYVKRPRYEKSMLPARVKAIQGSRLTLALRSAAELERFELLLGAKDDSGEPSEQALVLRPDADGWYRFSTLLDADLSLCPTLYGPHGLTNQPRGVCRIRVIPDKAPVARVISPSEEIAVGSDDVIDVEFEAHDDHGIAKVELVVYEESLQGEQRILSVQDIPLGDEEHQKHVLGTAQLDLSRFDLHRGMNVSYAVRVTDNWMRRVEPQERPVPMGEEADHPDADAEQQEVEDNGAAPSRPSAGPSMPTEVGNPEDEAKVGATETSPTEVGAPSDDGKPDDPPADARPTDNRPAESKGDSPSDAQTRGPDDDQGDSPATATGVSQQPDDVENGNASPRPESPPPAPSPEGDSPRVQSGNNSTADSERAPAESPNDPATQAESKRADGDPEPSSESTPRSETGQEDSPAPMPAADPEGDMNLEGQQGQDTESKRMRLKITDRIVVATEAGQRRRSDTLDTRELLLAIDEELEAAEATLLALNEQPDPGALPEKSQIADARLERAEQRIADLRNNTKDSKYAFVGLQILDIGRTHVTPARDRMFVLLQNPGSNPARNVLESLHHTTSARELLAALTRQFEEVAQERELAAALEEVAKIYEVYVEDMQGVLREARQNKNPLTRKMGVVEVDEAYLDRYHEVLGMRRDLMAELGRILSDDPRLMGKYMDVIKRRQSNLRNQLTELRERQEDISLELSGWLRANPQQRPDVWMQVAELRLLPAASLTRDASQLESRTLSQLPLVLTPGAGTAGQVVQHAKEVALQARQSAVTARRWMEVALANEEDNDHASAELHTIADELQYQLAELNAALELLAFEHADDEEVTDFVARRLAESRGVAEQAVAWAEMVSFLQLEQYPALAALDQQKLALQTEGLRIAMSTIEDDLSGLFQPEDVPPKVTNLVRELMIVIEAITFNQSAATFELDRSQLPQAETQQTLAVEGFARAEELFDKMRRTTVDILDQRDVDDPNIAGLEDPTLDQFLERLEREPNLGQLLGIPSRPTNLRVIQDWLLWETAGGGTEGATPDEAAAAAMERARQMARRRPMRKEEIEEAQRPASQAKLTEEEMRRFAAAEASEEELERLLRTIQEKIEQPATDEQQRKELQQKAEMLARLLEQARSGGANRKKWRQVAASDAMKAMLAALARGEAIPDNQWNQVLSALDSGLWQVRGRTPPEDYRQAIEQYQDQIRRLLNEESLDEQ